MWLVAALVAACGCGSVTGGGDSKKAAEAKAKATPGTPRTTTTAAAARGVSDGGGPALARGPPARTMEHLAASANRLLAAGRRRRVVPVVNATGVLLHTNLGRAPMGRRQLDAVAAVAAGYSNLEFDLAEGRRGSRYDHAPEVLTALTGARAALFVNNKAGAVR